ncbi:MAG: hypothetical protein SGPRY_007484, partial [Prymnesium sp.]
LDRSVHFTLDLSSVPCGCSAAVYMVAMPAKPGFDSSAYCDMRSGGEERGRGHAVCAEINLLSGNQQVRTRRALGR